MVTVGNILPSQYIYCMVCPPIFMAFSICVFACAQACVHVQYLWVEFSRDLLSRSPPWPLSVYPWYALIILLSANAKLTLIPKRITLLPFGF